jgi:predicted ribonuclease YlaK
MTQRTKKANGSMNVRIDDLLEFEPITTNQEKTFEAWDDGFNLMLAGCAGTGKTFIAMYLGLEAVLTEDTPYDKLIIIRSTVPVRDMGFLPGTKKEKEDPYTAVYKQIGDELFGDTSSYNKAVSSKRISFDTTSYLRGVTWRNAVVIVDEVQNLNFQELDTVMTRLGKNSRIIFCGDYKQTDFKYQSDKDGLFKFTNILEHLNMFKIINFNWDDIVRSGIVRDYLMTKEMLST